MISLHFGDEVPATLVFDHPSLSAIADFLVRRAQTAPALLPSPSALRLPSGGDASTSIDVTAVCGIGARYPKEVAGEEAVCHE